MQKIVVANLRAEIPAARAGARCLIIRVPGLADSAQVSVTSRGGRKVEIWLPLHNLANARIKNHNPMPVTPDYHGQSAEMVCALINSQS